MFHPATVEEKKLCPLSGQCREKNVVYQATVIPTQTPEDSKTYTGMTSTEFKDRFRNHNKSFNHLRYSKETTLSLHVWSLKNLNIDYDIQWKVIDRAKPFSPVTGVCNLCTLILYNFQTRRGYSKQKWRNLQALHSQKSPPSRQYLISFMFLWMLQLFVIISLILVIL